MLFFDLLTLYTLPSHLILIVTMKGKNNIFISIVSTISY